VLVDIDRRTVAMEVGTR